MNHAEELMRLAINAAKKGITSGQSPFGCAISLNGEVIAVAHNRVFADSDSTAHAEINAIREACKKIDDIHLRGAIVATTCEPCPMCLAALHWAQVERIYYGAAISDAADAGFNELNLSAGKLLEQGGSPIKLFPTLLQDECLSLFKIWSARPGHRSY